MRVALILLFLLALASLPGALLPQWSLNAAKTARVHRGQPDDRAVARAARLLRSLRGAVVRRDLLAAFRLPHRLPAAAHAGVPFSPASTAGGHPPQPRPATASRRGRGDRQLRRHGRADHHGPARLAGGGPHRARCRGSADGANHLGREGLSARGRQPRLPHLARRAARGDRGRQARGLRGLGDRHDARPVLLVDAGRIRQLPARPARRRHGPRPLLRRRPLVPGGVHRGRPGTRLRGGHPLPGGRRRRHRRLAERRAAGERSAAPLRGAALPARPRILAAPSRSRTRPARSASTPSLSHPSRTTRTSPRRARSRSPTPLGRPRRTSGCGSSRSWGSSRRPPSCTAGC